MSSRRSRSRSPRRRHSPLRRHSDHHDRDRDKRREGRRDRDQDRESPKRERRRSHRDHGDEKRQSDRHSRDEKGQREKEKERDKEKEKEREKAKEKEREKRGKEERDSRKRHRSHSPRLPRQKEGGKVEVEEEGQEKQRTDRFKSERFETEQVVGGSLRSDGQALSKTLEERLGPPLNGANSRIPYGRGRGRGRGRERGGWGERDTGADDIGEQRLFESLTDPRDVPKSGYFFEHDDRDAPPQRRAPSLPARDWPGGARRRSYTSDEPRERHRQDRDSELGRDGDRERSNQWERNRGGGRGGNWEREREWDRGKGRRRDDQERGRWQQTRGRERDRSPFKWKHDLFEVTQLEEEDDEEDKEWRQQRRSVVQKAPSPLSQSKWEREQATEQETSAGQVQVEEMEQGAEEKTTSLDADDPFCLNELIQQEAD